MSRPLKRKVAQKKNWNNSTILQAVYILTGLFAVSVSMWTEEITSSLAGLGAIYVGVNWKKWFE